MDVRIFTEPQQGASYGDLLAVAQTAEAEGFSAFFRSDHYLKMGSGTGLPGPTDAWVTLAGLSRETTTIRLGTLVNAATFRLPGPLAVTVAQVDEMSGGRVELGLGTGWYMAEHLAYGIPFPDVGDRFDLLTEQLEIISGLWSTPVGETFDHAGAIYTIKDSPALPKPVQKPGPPIIIGGGGPKRTAGLTARFATEWNRAFVSVGTFAANRANVRAACERIERDPDDLAYSIALIVCCGENDAEISHRAAAIGRDVDDLRKNGLAGTPAEILEKVATYVEAGAERLYLQVMDLADLDHLRLLGSEVLPNLQR